MDFFDVKNTFQSMFPGKAITYSFDDKCMRHVEMMMTEGNPNPRHHVEYNQVKVSVEGMPDQYIKIMPHREVISLSALKPFVASKNDVHVNQHEIDNFKSLSKEEQVNKLQEWVDMTGMPRDQIEKKLQS